MCPAASLQDRVPFCWLVEEYMVKCTTCKCGRRTIRYMLYLSIIRYCFVGAAFRVNDWRTFLAMRSNRLAA